MVVGGAQQVEARLLQVEGQVGRGVKGGIAAVAPLGAGQGGLEVGYGQVGGTQAGGDRLKTGAKVVAVTRVGLFDLDSMDDDVSCGGNNGAADVGSGRGGGRGGGNRAGRVIGAGFAAFMIAEKV